jgi:DNA methylase
MAKKVSYNSAGYDEFPRWQNREINHWIRELFFREQGKISLKTDAYLKTITTIGQVWAGQTYISQRTSPEVAISGETLNLVVWNKSNAGQGSFYRSQHELIGVFRVGGHPHRNNIELGRFGRNRSNVWTYAGVNTFGRGRMEALAAHPTVKPVSLVADALLDCTGRGDVVLDQFAGSGTTILAAERVGRIGFGVEYEPGYVDVAIKRWQRATKLEATLCGDGRSFGEIGAVRANANDAPHHPGSKSTVAQSHPGRATKPKAASAFGGEGAPSSQIAAGPESGHA